MKKIALSDSQLDSVVRKKVACPFMGPAVRRRELAVYSSVERPMAAIQDIVDLGDTGGGDLGRRVLRIFAVGNHRRMPGPLGQFDEAVPAGMMSLDLAGSQGAHPGHSGIMLGHPAELDAGRFSQEDFARLAHHANADGRLSVEAVGRFVAENLARDPDAKVFPIARLAADLFGLADEVFDSLQARLLGRRTERDEAELLEKLTKLAGADNLIGSAGEFGLLFAFFAHRGKGESDDEPGLDIADLEAMMAHLRLPDGWASWPKKATDWIHATTKIAAFATRARLND